MRKVLLVLLTSLSFLSSWSQIDREFWFAAPEVTQEHDDRPILLRMSSVNQDARIRVSVPADSTFDSIIVEIPAGQATSLDLTEYIDILEIKPPDEILNKGLHVLSDAPITAYYEVKGGDFNSDLFALKGENALGTEFYTPFQNIYPNFPGVDGWSSFDIVATEDSTVVTITPTNDIVGHPANQSFTIILNRGQTYSAQATSKSPADHLQGSHIVSNKPIAVTTKDDSVRDGGWDLIGDQLVPVSVLGTEYIVGDGWNIFLAVEDNTEITDGQGNNIGTIDAGEQIMVQRANGNPYYVTSTKPIYVFNVLKIEAGGSFGGEISGALIPQIICTGSDRVSFTRSAFEEFWLLILVKTAGKEDFVLNGDDGVINGFDFQLVPGTNGEWSWTRKYIVDPDIVPIGEASLIRNTSTVFHLGLLMGTGSTGAKYGYFSNFGNLDLGIDFVACDHENIILDAGLGRDSYEWSTGETTSFIKVDTSGEYWVSISEGPCQAQDTINVVVKPGVQLDLGPDVFLCSGDSVVLVGQEDSLSHVWSTGDTTNSITVSETDTIYLAVTNSVDCTNKDTIIIEVETPLDPPFFLDTLICDGDTLHLELDSLVDRASYFFDINWSTGDTTQNVFMTEEGNYTVSLTGQCDTVMDAFFLEVDDDTLVDFGPDFFFCSGDPEVLSGPDSMVVYEWSTGDTVSFISIDEPGTYSLFVVNQNGCEGADTVEIEELFLPNFDLPEDTVLCTEETLELRTEEGHHQYIWSTGDTTVSIVVDEPGVYMVDVTNPCGTITDTAEVAYWDVFIPNVVTPNDDGKNEFFVVDGIEKGTWKLQVFNRWGQSIYFEEFYENEWPEVIPEDGTYFFHLTEEHSEERCNNYKGWIFLTK